MTSHPPPPPTAPGGHPVLGHTVPILGGPLDALERFGATDAPIVRIAVAGREFCLLCDPAAVEAVLLTDSDRYRKADIVRERLGTLQGRSLVLLEGEQWRERRRTLQSAFAPEQVADAGPLTTRYTQAMVDDWPVNARLRVDEHARDLALSILATVLFDLDLRGESTPIHEAADDILARMDLQSVSAYLPEWIPTQINRRFRRAVTTLHDRLDATVADRDGPDGGDLLSTMIAAGLPPETVRDELIAFLFAGFDSTATALSCTLSLLAAHPEEQAALATELDTVVGDGRPTAEHLSSLKRLAAVVRESLRLYPPQYLLFRQAEKDVTLEGYALSADTTLLVPPWVLHRDKRFWEAPESFRPERWLGDSDGGRPEYAYLPYGGGPRRCIGARMADVMLKLIVAVVVDRRRLRAVTPLSVSAGPTLSLDSGVTLRTAHR